MLSKVVILGAVTAAILGILSSIESDEAEICIVDRGAAFPKSRARVFTFVSDLSHYAEWFPSTVSFDPTDNTPMSVGKHFSEVYRSTFFGEITYDNVVTGYESPYYISLLNDGIMKFRIEMKFEKRPGNEQYPSRLVYKLYTRRNSLLSKHLIGPLVGYLMNESWIRPGLFFLRSIVETTRV